MKKIHYLLALTLVLLSQVAYAIVIAPNTVINSPTIYSNEVIDLSHGNLIIKRGASLTIRDSKINGVLSEENPTLIAIESGTLTMRRNKVAISAPSMTPNPYAQSLAYVVRANNAKIQLVNNEFKMADEFVGGLLITNDGIQTEDIVIERNKIEGFHGALYLLNSNNAFINNNILRLNSYGNIVLIGRDGQISNNSIYFSGRDKLGNAMDVIDSYNISIANNVVWTPTCHGIYIFASEGVAIDNNNVASGITYGITVLGKEELSQDAYATALSHQRNSHFVSKSITISNNYFSQNRYGINASDVEGLLISNNYFSQHFNDAASRQFWTDNTNLLKNISDLQWLNNFYKEAFTQVNGDSNALTQIVPFPETGGVSL